MQRRKFVAGMVTLAVATRATVQQAQVILLVARTAPEYEHLLQAGLPGQRKCRVHDPRGHFRGATGRTSGSLADLRVETSPRLLDVDHD